MSDRLACTSGIAYNIYPDKTAYRTNVKKKQKTWNSAGK